MTLCETAYRCTAPTESLFCVSGQPPFANLRPVNIALPIYCHTFGRIAVCVETRVWNESHDTSIRDTADTNAPEKAIGSRIVSTHITRIQDVLAINKNTARHSELVPTIEVCPVLIKYLNASIASIGNKIRPCESIAIP